MTPPGRWTVLLLATVAIGGARAAPADALPEVWQEASRAQFADALRRLDPAAEAPAAPAASAEVRYARALLLLNTPPTTDARLDVAAALLQGVAGDRTADPALAAAAAHFAARIEAVHRLQPDLREAKRRYHEAWQQHRPTAWAERSALKWLTLHLAGVGTEAAPAERLRDGEQLGADLHVEEVRKNYHLLMAEAWARLAPDRTPVLEHLLAADAFGILHPQTRADVFCAIGRNAQALGRPAVALQYYEKYLSEFSRDARRHTILQEVKQLKGAGS